MGFAQLVARMEYADRQAVNVDSLADEGGMETPLTPVPREWEPALRFADAFPLTPANGEGLGGLVGLGPGRQVGRFVLERPLGPEARHGAWLARDSERGDHCVVKIHGVGPGGAWQWELVRAEAKALQRTSHPNLVGFRATVFDRATGIAAVVTDWVPGIDLANFVARGSVLVEDALGILRGCARGLQALHAAGVVHGDLHPGNVVVTGDADSRSATLIDLGMAAIAGSRRSVPGGVLGFLAPESVLGQPPTPASDQYSLGCIVHFLITGEPPVPARETLDALARGEDPFAEAGRRARDAVPAPFREVCNRLLARSPVGRYASVADTLATLQVGEGISAESEVPDAPRAVPGEPMFVGRVAERRRLLRAALGALRGHQPCVALLRGPRGCGRTRILEQVRRVAELRGFSVIFVRPGSETHRPLDPLIDALRRAAHGLPEALVAEAELVGASVGAGTGGSLDWSDASGRLLEALRVASSAPVAPLIVFDDAGMLDEWSRSVLTHLVASKAPAAPVILAAMADSSPGEGGEAARALRHRLLRSPHAFEMLLGDLGGPAAADFVKGLLGSMEGSREISARIREATGGIPGEMLEVIRGLLFSHRVRAGAAGWSLVRAEEPLPLGERLRDAIRERLDALRPSQRSAIQGLGAFGGRALPEDWEEIRLVSGLDDAGEGALFHAGLLQRDVETGHVRSTSDEVMAAAVARTTPADASSWGLRFAERETVRGRGSSPAAVRALLGAGMVREAVSRGAAAVREILRAGRTEEAIRLAERLLASGRGSADPGPMSALADEAAAALLLDRRPRDALAILRRAGGDAPTADARRSLLVREAEAAAAAGEDPAGPLARLTELDAGPDEEARAALARARFLAGAGRGSEAGEALAAVDRLPGVSVPIRIRVLNGIANIAIGFGELDRASGAFEAALVLADRAGETAARFALLLNLSRLDVRRRRARHSLRRAGQALGLLGPALSLSDEAALLLVRASAFEALGRWRSARDAGASAARIAQQAGLPSMATNAFRRWGEAEARAGSFREGIRLLSRAIDIGAREGSERDTDEVRLALSGLLLDRADVAGCLAQIEALTPLARGGFVARSLACRARALTGGAAGSDPEFLALREAPAASAFPAEWTRLRIAEATAMPAAAAPARVESLRQLYRATLRAGDADNAALCLVEIGKSLAADAPGAARAELLRAVRLAARLQDLVLRAAVLETSGRVLESLGDVAAAGQQFRDAAVLYEAASLSERAPVMTREGDAAASGWTWRGLSPERLAWALEQIGRVNEAENPEAVLDALLDAAISLTAAERGFLVTVSPGGMQVRTARAFDATNLRDPAHELSTSILEAAVLEGRSTISTNASEDDRFAAFVSVRRMQLRSVLAVPIRRGGRALGAFYLDNRFLAGVFKEQDCMALELLAEQAAVTFENLQYRDEVRTLNERIQRRLEEQEAEIETMRTTVRTIRRETKYAYEGILCRGGAMADALRAVDRAVESDVPVILEGESGTGKELVARAIHFYGPRKDHPLVVVNCAALPDSLLESELFGHRRGAFTGAYADRKGQFEAADGGTLFLDEVGELPLAVQPKLLRALQFGEFIPLGFSEPRRANVRVVSATNRDLQAMVSSGDFREDLYYRLAVFPVRLPPLRERRHDIGQIAENLVRRLAGDTGKGPRRLHPRAVARLIEHDWPGNVRELENVLRRAVLVGAGDTILPEDLAIERRKPSKDSPVLEEIRRGLSVHFAPREEAALARVVERGRITLRELVGLFGISRATGARDLRRLVGLKILVRRGRTTAAYYEFAHRWEEVRREAGDTSGDRE